MDATCPRCGRGRVGAFRFCLACGFDYEPRPVAERPGSVDPEPVRPVAAIPIESPALRPPTSVTATGTPVSPVAAPAVPAAISSPPSGTTAGGASMSTAPAPVAEAPPPMAESKSPTPPWSMPVESFDAIDPAADRAAPPDPAPVLARRADAHASDDDDISLGAFLVMLVLGGAFLVAVFFAAVQFLV